MPFRYHEEAATAGIELVAWGQSLEEMVRAAADATTGLMVEDPDSLAKDEVHTITAESAAEDLLLVEVLQEIIFYKDAHQLLLRLDSAKIDRDDGNLTFTGIAHGEKLGRARHRLAVDVKAVTLHRLSVERSGRRWKATVVLET